MDVNELIETAWAAVRSAGVPENVQEAAFLEAAAFLTSGVSRAPGSPRVVDSSDRDEAGSTENSSRNAVDADTFFDRLSRETEIGISRLQKVFHFENGEPTLNQRGSDLGDTKRARVQRIAHLITGARQLGLGESSTESEIIRTAAKSYQACDGNFATYIRDLSADITYSGPTKKKILTLKPSGERKFRSLLAEDADPA